MPGCRRGRRPPSCPRRSGRGRSAVGRTDGSSPHASSSSISTSAPATTGATRCQVARSASPSPARRARPTDTAAASTASRRRTGVGAGRDEPGACVGEPAGAQVEPRGRAAGAAWWPGCREQGACGVVVLARGHARSWRGRPTAPRPAGRRARTRRRDRRACWRRAVEIAADRGDAWRSTPSRRTVSPRGAAPAELVCGLEVALGGVEVPDEARGERGPTAGERGRRTGSVAAMSRHRSAASNSAPSAAAAAAATPPRRGSLGRRRRRALGRRPRWRRWCRRHARPGRRPGSRNRGRRWVSPRSPSWSPPCVGSGRCSSPERWGWRSWSSWSSVARWSSSCAGSSWSGACRLPRRCASVVVGTTVVVVTCWVVVVDRGRTSARGPRRRRAALVAASASAAPPATADRGDRGGRRGHEFA